VRRCFWCGRRTGAAESKRYVCKLTRVSLLAAACEHKSEVWLQTEVKQFSSRDGTEWQRQVEEAEESKQKRQRDRQASIDDMGSNTLGKEHKGPRFVDLGKPESQSRCEHGKVAGLAGRRAGRGSMGGLGNSLWGYLTDLVPNCSSAVTKNVQSGMMASPLSSSLFFYSSLPFPSLHLMLE
jgi:hypothetical protein